MDGRMNDGMGREADERMEGRKGEESVASNNSKCSSLSFCYWDSYMYSLCEHPENEKPCWIFPC